MGNKKSKIILSDKLKLPKKNKKYQKKLFKALYNANLKKVEKLLDSVNGSVDFYDKNKRTPLMWACYHGWNNLACKMIEIHGHACLPELRDIDGYTALFLATDRIMPDVVKQMLKHFSDEMICNPGTLYNNGYTTLLLMCRVGMFDNALQYLKTFGKLCDTTTSDNKGYTAFLYACKNGHEDLACELFEYDWCCPNRVSEDTKIGYKWAKKNNMKNIMNLLEKFDPVINSKFF